MLQSKLMLSHRFLFGTVFSKTLIQRAAIVTFCLVLFGCRRHETAVDAGLRTQTLLLGNGAEPADLDPALIVAWNDSNIAYALFEGLTWIDERTTQPIPAAALNWDVSTDGRVYTFHLRPTGRWSNGDPVTAADFVYAYRRMLTPSFGAQYSYMLWAIKNAEAYNEGKLTDFSQVGVKALDALTLQVTLEQPTPYLPALAAHSTWLPVHQATVEKYGRFDQRDSAWTRPGNLVGNGPFVLKAWIPNGKVVVEKNPQYYDSARVRLNRIEFFPMEDHQAEESAFRAGQLHVTYGLPYASISRVRREQPGTLQSDALLSSFYLFFNVRRAPFDNPKLRRALSLAVDRDTIAKNVLLGAQQAAASFTPPDCGGYTPRASVPTDLALAKKLLAEAGYPDGRGLPTIEVLSYQTESFVHVLEVIQAEWAKNLGIHITITPQELKMLFRNQHEGNFALAGASWIADYPDPLTFLGIMVSGGGNNWPGWSDKTFDELLKKAGQTSDPAQRFEYFQQSEARLLDQAPLIPLFFETQNYLKQPTVRGWIPSKLNYHRFKDLWLEK